MIPHSPLLPDNTPGTKLDWIKQNQHICLNPYTVLHQQIDNTNNLKISCCCNLELTDSIDYSFEDLKNTITKGINNKRCQKCYASEAQVGTSERTMSLIGMNTAHLEQFLDTGTVNHFEFRIKFSNLCNLACKTCQPEFSSKYAQVYNIVVAKELQEDISNQPDFWNNLTTQIANKCNYIDNVCISLLGGESLIQPGAIKLINWLIENNLSSKVTLRLTTNFTNLKKNIIDKFSKFKSVTVCASIDSVNNNYSYVRYPATFDTIESNLSFILENSNINFYVTPVWSLHNIFYINEYIDWWHNWFNKHNLLNVPINNVSMSDPHIMTVQNLPVEYRKPLLAILEYSFSHELFNNNIHSQSREYLKGVIDFLSSDKIVYNQFDDFLKQAAKDDCYTKMTMAAGNEKLYNILNDEHKQYYNRLLAQIS